MNFQQRVGCLKTDQIHILQLNITKKCNLKCNHCHVEASPKRMEKMSEEMFDRCMELYDRFHFDTIDITGGEPSLHPSILSFLEKAGKRGGEVIFRSNLVGLDRRFDLVDQLIQNNVHIVCSLPCYTKENVDGMRGNGVFEAVLRSLRILNERGYGKTLPLDLVNNPLGAYLPAPQKALEEDYRKELEAFGVTFSNLLTITNLPLGYFKRKLEQEGQMGTYMNLLEENFNPDTVEKLMCRYQISVGYDGKVYDCDFHQMENIVADSYVTVDEILQKESIERDIVLKNYCYGCTAGAGSSCGGALNE